MFNHPDIQYNDHSKTLLNYDIALMLHNQHISAILGEVPLLFEAFPIKVLWATCFYADMRALEHYCVSVTVVVQHSFAYGGCQNRSSCGVHGNSPFLD